MFQDKNVIGGWNFGHKIGSSLILIFYYVIRLNKQKSFFPFFSDPKSEKSLWHSPLSLLISWLNIDLKISFFFLNEQLFQKSY